MPQSRRAFLLLASLALLSASLSGCGRRGPLDLPPDVQARGDALRAEQEAKAKTTRAKPKPGEDVADKPAPPIPGTIGNRPPDQYPFPLDPLL